MIKEYNNHSKRALSLLETLLTVTIITIAVSVVLPVSKIYIVAQREETLKKNLAEIREAIDKFQKKESRYPNSIDELLENRYLRRMETEPFGGKWQYKPHTGEHEWVDFEVTVLTGKPYLASNKNKSMKARKYKVKKSDVIAAAESIETVETTETALAPAPWESGAEDKDKDKDKANNDKGDSATGEDKDKDKDKDNDTAEVGLTDGVTIDGAYEVELYEEIYDIRTATDYTGINGVPYNQW
jgi:type II secretory pathway pseudopilin PulG